MSSSIPPYCLAAFLLTTNSPGSNIAGILSPDPDPGTHEPFCNPTLPAVVINPAYLDLGVVLGFGFLGDAAEATALPKLVIKGENLDLYLPLVPVSLKSCLIGRSDPSFLVVHQSPLSVFTVCEGPTSLKEPVPLCETSLARSLS